MENRMRFLVEVFQAMRSRVAPDYPILIKISATDAMKNGLTLDESLQMARMMDEMGMDGIEVLRPMHVFGQDDAPHGHMHLRFTDVRVPARNIVLGEGRGFEVAQGRLGPGRIHHCMRSIGLAEKALELMCLRGLHREAFGKRIIDLGAYYDIIANARMEIEQARLLCLKAAWMMDTQGTRAAQPWISQIKVVAPRVALKVVDEAVLPAMSVNERP